ncbi:MAG: hypothetical protein AAGF59_12675, partial [Pseudomonadota bacterium]
MVLDRYKPESVRRGAIALLYGAACHSLFALGVGAMIVAMYFGMSQSFGSVARPWAIPANLLLLAQFPLAHSLLLTKAGRRLLTRFAPEPHGATLATTTYAAIASVQLGLLFALWTPSGVIWWQADGPWLALMTGLYAGSWCLLGIAILQSGWQLQSGALGWLALLFGRKPVYPDLPFGGLYRFVRHPIYSAFALTLWTIPTWTPDQLCLAAALTLYCLLAPLHRESSARHSPKTPSQIRSMESRILSALGCVLAISSTAWS